MAPSQQSSSTPYSTIAGQIAALPFRTSEEKIYQDALKKYINDQPYGQITIEEIQMITTKSSPEELKSEIIARRNNAQASKGLKRSIAGRFLRASVEQMERFQQAIDVMSQTSTTIMAPLWGSIRVLLILSREIFDTLERLIELSKTIDYCLKRFQKYLRVIKLGDILEERLIEFYYNIIQFCLESQRLVHSKSTGKIALSNLWSPIKPRFESLHRALRESADEVDKAAVAENMVLQNNKLDRLARSPVQRALQTSTSKATARNLVVPDLCSPHFSGRIIILEKLRRALVDAQTTSIKLAAIWGLPGMGKTQVALRYASLCRLNYQHIFFIRADSDIQLSQDFKLIWSRLDLNKGPNAADANHLIVDQVKRWLEQNDGWLLILDNVTKASMARQHLPRTSSGEILITTRDETIASNLASPGCSFELDNLPDQEALSLIFSILGTTEETSTAKKAAIDLNKLVNGLPLALEQAAYLAREMNKPQALVAVATALRQHRQVLKHPSAALNHQTTDSTFALFEMAFDALKKRTPSAAALFRLLVHLDTTSIPVDLLEIAGAEVPMFLGREQTYSRGAVPPSDIDLQYTLGMAAFADPPVKPSHREVWMMDRIRKKLYTRAKDRKALQLNEYSSDTTVRKYLYEENVIRVVLSSPPNLRSAISELIGAGLVRKNDVESISIHDLVRDIQIEAVRTETTASPDIQPLSTMTLVYLAFPVPSVLPISAYELCMKYLPHALATMRHCQDFAFNTIIGPEMMHIIGSTLSLPSSDRILEPMAKRIERVEGWYQRAYIGYTGITHRMQRLHTRAEICRDAQVDYTSHFNPETPGFQRLGQAPRRAIDTAFNLSRLYSHRRKTEALVWAKVATRGYSDLFGAHHVLTYKALNSQARLEIQSRQWDGALKTALRVFDICNIRETHDHQDGGMTAQLVSEIYERQEDFKAALVWEEKALRALEADLGPDDPLVASSLLRQSRLNRKMRNYNTARAQAVRALAIREIRNKKSIRFCHLISQARCDLAVTMDLLGSSEEAAWLLSMTNNLIIPDMRAFRKPPKPGEPPLTGWLTVLSVTWNLMRIISSGNMEEIVASVDKEVEEQAVKTFGSYRDWPKGGDEKLTHITTDYVFDDDS